MRRWMPIVMVSIVALDGCVLPTGDAKATDADGDGYTASVDCDDGDAAVHPGASELCDGVDDDCDGTVDGPDAADALTWYADADDDGFGDADTTTRSCEAPSGFVADGSDCYDDDPTAFPGADELCNVRDDDCDGTIDEDDATDTGSWYPDADGDGYGAEVLALEACWGPRGYVSLTGDCDDADATISPAAAEMCDGVDDDCDGVVDEDYAADAPIWYADADGDGFGDPGLPTWACSMPASFVAQGSDCDDGDADVSPDATELCNTIDDDCDGVIDEDSATDAPTWYADGDGDGFGSADEVTVACMPPPTFTTNDEDCDDTTSDVSPAATELCNGRDDDCDDVIDEGDAADAPTWYADADGDGCGDPATSTTACDAPSDFVSNVLDCDDTSASVSALAAEVCDGIDDDCDSEVDEDSASDAPTWYVDGDGDGYGDAAGSTVACLAPAGYAAGADDCDDTRTDTHPGAGELCDGNDRDCDGVAPIGLAVPTDYATITEAIDAASDGDTVCVAPGTWVEAVDFGGKDLTLLGAGSGATFIDASAGPITMAGGRLAGFTVENGSGSAYNLHGGGGTEGTLDCYEATSPASLEDVIFAGNKCETSYCWGLVDLQDCDMELTDVAFQDNAVSTSSLRGGLLYATDSTLTVSGLSMTDNVVASNVWAGGLVYVVGGGQTWSDVTIEGNELTFDAAGYGGLIKIGDTGGSTIDFLVVRDNTVTMSTGSLYGGVLATYSAVPLIRWADVRANKFTRVGQGGLFYSSGGERTTFEHLVAAGNTVDGDTVRGGILYGASGDSGTTIRITYADIYANSISGNHVYGGITAGYYAPASGTWHFAIYSTLYLDMVSIVGNTTSGTTYGSVYYHTGSWENDSISYGNIYGNSGTAFYNATDPAGWNGNIEVDPIYVDATSSAPGDWDLSLGAGSPLLDAGDPAELDADGTVCQIGAYGGPDGAW